MFWLCSIVLCCLPALAIGQGSHRPLAPPAFEGSGKGANVDLLRQLQQAVEQSEGPDQAPIDPTQIDPKLMEAMLNLADQLKENPELSPQMLQWMKALAESKGLSVPQDLNSLPPELMPQGPDPDRPDREHVFDLRQNRPNDDPTGTNSPLNQNRNGSPRPNTGSPNTRTPGAQSPGAQNRFQPGGANSPRTPGQPTPRDPRSPGNDPPRGLSGENQLPREATAEKSTSSPRNINLEQLRDSGMSIQQQFDRVVEQARRDAIMNRSNPDSEGQRGGLGRLFNEALAKSSEEMLERWSKSRRNRSANQSRNHDRTTSRGTTGEGNLAESSPFSKQFESLSNQAHRLGRSITDAPIPAAAANVSPESEFTVPSASTGFSILTVLLAIAALGAVAYAWLTWQRRITSSAQRRSAPMLPARLTSRQEVLRAFHTLAARTGAGEHGWWTHRRAGQAMADAAPQARTAVEALTQVYEQARYLPANEPLDPGQLRVAGEAIGIMGQAHPVIQRRGEQ